MTNIAAAIGVAQMERIDEHLERRRQVSQWYFDRLCDHQDLLQLPHAAPWADHSYWMFTVLLQPHLNIDRDQWMAQLETAGIETRPVFYPVHWMPPYQRYSGHFPVADQLSARGINLPTHGKLSESDVDYVCQQVIASIEQLRSRRAVKKAA
jgi:perosamine synthetase